jgi:Signal transduction histidine kinase
MRPYIFFLLFFLSSLEGTVSAVIDLNSTFITSNDGLGNNFVRHIFQDSKGFLWMSTLNGLTRYDGYSFVTFRPGKGDKISLIGRHVREVSEDKNHFLWIQTSFEHFNCYDLRSECFVDFTGCGEYKAKYSHRIETKNGDSWLWYYKTGCRKISFKNGKFESFIYSTYNGKLPSNYVKKIKEDNHGNVWICTSNGLVRVKDGKSQIMALGINFIDIMFYKGNIFLLTPETDIYKVDLKKNRVKFLQRLSPGHHKQNITSSFLFRDKWVVLTSLKGYVFHLLYEKKTDADNILNIPNGRNIRDKQNNLWIYDDKGWIRYINATTGIAKDFHIKIGERVTDEWCQLIQDSRGWIWIATFGDGLYVYNPVLDEITHFSYQAGSLNRICSNSLAFVMEDRSGNIWVTSESAGITRFTVLNDKVTHFYPENKSVINNTDAIRLINQTGNNNIWIGNRKGDLYKYDGQLQKRLQTIHFNSSIYSMQEDKNGKIWLGSRGNGLCIDGYWYTPQTNTPRSISSEKIFSIFCDYKGRMWVGTYGGGLNLAIRNSGKYYFRHFLMDNEEQRGIRFITNDKNNWMWVGTSNGLYVFHPDSLIASSSNYYHFNYDNNKLLANEVKFVLCDSKSRMWIGTLGGGLSFCVLGRDYKNLSFTHFTRGNGLVDNVIQSMVEDNEGKIWIATEYGISRFSPNTLTFENFFFSSTIQGNVYSENSVLKLSDGRLLFGTNYGMTIIDPKRIASPQAFTNVVLTDLKVNGISLHPADDDSPLTRALAYTNKIELAHYQNSFVIEFSTFDYSMSNETQYTYKLEPFDTEWSKPSSLNFAVYKKMKPGTYRLHVKACNSSGMWSKKETILEITIKPPFWQSAVAYILYLILACIILYVVFRLARKFNALRNRIQVEKQLTDYKLMFFTNISHEFRTPLTLIKGALEKFESLSSLPEEASYPIRLMSKSTDRMLRLVNQLLEFHKMQNNKLALMLEQTDIIPFFQEIFFHFDEMAKDKRINYSFDPSIDSCMAYIDRGKLDKVVYNLLSNAFKYTPDGGSIIFVVHPDKQTGRLILSVSDTGIGISKEKQRELFSRFMQTGFSQDSVGVGLHLTHELVNVHKGTICYNERTGGGSVFTVSLPLDTAMYKEEDYMPTHYFLQQPMMQDVDGETPIETVATKKNVLLIEDDIDVSKYLEKELSPYFKVDTARDGLSGLESAKTFNGDLIICDVLMPGMNGFEVTSHLKNDFNTSHIPIILLTAMSSADDQLKGTLSGADAYITKPFSLKLLLARMNQLIEQRKKLRDRLTRDPACSSLAISTTEIDREFADKLNKIMESELSNSDYSVDDFAAALKLGRTSFFRKVKGVTGYTPNEYMRIFRLKKALELIHNSDYNISEIAYKVGMNDPHYFSRCFKELFGVAPTSCRQRDNKSSL